MLRILKILQYGGSVARASQPHRRRLCEAITENSFFTRQHHFSLPASTRSAAAGTAAAKSAKSTAAAKSASAPSSADVPTVYSAAKQKPPEYQRPARRKQCNKTTSYK